MQFSSRRETKQLLSYCRFIFPFERTYNLYVNEIEATYKRPPVNVKVKRGSTFTFTRDLPNIVFILFTRVRTEK